MTHHTLPFDGRFGEAAVAGAKVPARRDIRIGAEAVSCYSDEHLRFDQAAPLSLVRVRPGEPVRERRPGEYRRDGRRQLQAVALVSCGVMTGWGAPARTARTATERSVLGSFVGSCHPARDVPLLLSLYRQAGCGSTSW